MTICLIIFVVWIWLALEPNYFSCMGHQPILSTKRIYYWRLVHYSHLHNNYSCYPLCNSPYGRCQHNISVQNIISLIPEVAYVYPMHQSMVPDLDKQQPTNGQQRLWTYHAAPYLALWTAAVSTRQLHSYLCLFVYINTALTLPTRYDPLIWHARLYVRNHRSIVSPIDQHLYF